MDDHSKSVYFYTCWFVVTFDRSTHEPIFITLVAAYRNELTSFAEPRTYFYHRDSVKNIQNDEPRSTPVLRNRVTIRKEPITSIDLAETHNDDTYCAQYNRFLAYPDSVKETDTKRNSRFLETVIDEKDNDVFKDVSHRRKRLVLYNVSEDRTYQLITCCKK